MLIFFEVARPFRSVPKFERIGAVRRLIFGWFSVGYIRAGINEMLAAFAKTVRSIGGADTMSELSAVTAERNRAQQACEQMGRRLSEIAAVEADVREQAVGSQDGYLLDVANRLRDALQRSGNPG